MAGRPVPAGKYRRPRGTRCRRPATGCGCTGPRRPYRRVQEDRPLPLPGLHPIPPFQPRLVRLARGGRVELSVGPVPVSGKVLQSALEVFGRQLEQSHPLVVGLLLEHTRRVRLLFRSGSMDSRRFLRLLS